MIWRWELMDDILYGFAKFGATRKFCVDGTVFFCGRPRVESAIDRVASIARRS